MDEIYTLFIKKSVKEAFYMTGVSYEAACNFLVSHKYGLVKDASGNKYFTKEELKNAKYIGSVPVARRDNTSTSFGTLSETTDRKLSFVDTDNSEQSSDSDNKRDKFTEV